MPIINAIVYSYHDILEYNKNIQSTTVHINMNEADTKEHTLYDLTYIFYKRTKINKQNYFLIVNASRMDHEWKRAIKEHVSIKHTSVLDILGKFTFRTFTKMHNYNMYSFLYVI